jgi:hypothetical protein
MARCSVVARVLVPVALGILTIPVDPNVDSDSVWINPAELCDAASVVANRR